MLVGLKPEKIYYLGIGSIRVQRKRFNDRYRGLVCCALNRKILSINDGDGGLRERHFKSELALPQT